MERSVTVATKVTSELLTDLQMDSIPLKELSPLAEEINLKTREESQQTNLDMREFLGIDNAYKAYRVNS